MFMALKACLLFGGSNPDILIDTTRPSFVWLGLGGL